MDLLTQGLLGAALAQAVAKPREARVATAAGFAAGLLADADVLIQRGNDPLLALEAHRHFTHALVFVPVLALAAALLVWPFLRGRLAFGRVLVFTASGASLSGVLDACTSYGTHLLWPFSDARTAWNLVAIVDPLFTACLGLGVGIGLVRRASTPARVGLLAATAYLGLGLLQRERAEDLASRLAASRGHAVEHLLVKPTMGNLVLWRSLYEVDGRVYADGIRPGLGRGARIYPGESVGIVTPEEVAALAPRGSRARRDLERFTRLAEGFVAANPAHPGEFGDVRYAMLPTSLDPLWGLALDPDDAEAVPQFFTRRSLPPDVRGRFLAMLRGVDPQESISVEDGTQEKE